MMEDLQPSQVRCADCGLATITAGEWYMVGNGVWDEAWLGRREPGWRHVPFCEILCIGCLEARLGRTLTAHDFTDAPVNDLNSGKHFSDRLLDRLTRPAQK
jgi:hypothetical protein